MTVEVVEDKAQRYTDVVCLQFNAQTLSPLKGGEDPKGEGKPNGCLFHGKSPGFANHISTYHAYDKTGFFANTLFLVFFTCS